MEIDRKLLNPFFEGYKLSFNNSKGPIVQFYDLNQSMIPNKCERNNLSDAVDFQVLADQIYENRLQSTKNNLYFLSKSNDLIFFSKQTLETSLIKGPFDCFGVVSCENNCKNDLILGGQAGEFKLFVMSNESGKNASSSKFFTIKSQPPIHLENEHYKILGLHNSSKSLQVLLQKTVKIKDLENILSLELEEYEKSLEKAAFVFYSLSIPLKDENLKSVIELTLKSEIIGWSSSRPNYSFVGLNRILLGAPTGLVLLNVSVSTSDEKFVVGTEIKNEAERTSVIDPMKLFLDDNQDYDDENESDLLTTCRISDLRFKNNETETDNLILLVQHQYPEVTIIGQSIRECNIPIKYLHDVVIFNLNASASVNDEKEEKPKHVQTFPAINFIQSGKVDRKFTIFGHDYAFIIEGNGNIYAYNYDSSDCQRSASAAPILSSAQFLVQLELEGHDVLGWSMEVEKEVEVEYEILYVLTVDKIFKIMFSNQKFIK